MRDQHTRSMLIEAVIAGGLIAIGIPTGGPLATIAAGVGVNWAHSLAERGFQHWRERWFTDDGVLNHDIAKALCHAFVEAVRQVEHDWRQHRHYQYLRHKSPEQAQLTLDALRFLREDGADLFRQLNQLAQVAQQQHDSALSSLVQDESKANEYLKPVLAAFLSGHDDAFVTFVTQQFGPKWILRFLEILKGPDEEGTRAWRACQLLWQKSLMQGIEQMQQTTAETAEAVQWLQAWAQQLASLPPTQRNPIGQDALEAILHEVVAQLGEMHTTLDKTYATALDIKAMTLDIKTTLAELAPALPKPQAQPITVSGNRNRQHMLERVRTTWITGVLEHSLHDAALIALGLHEEPSALANPWRPVVQEIDRPAQPLPAGTRITDVYDKADGALLILGEPGAGKTTLLLELARELLIRAQADEGEPIPAVFNLSSWAQKPGLLTDWLVEELSLRYRVPRSLAQTWMDHDQLLLLLDGLDDVAAAQRSACIQAINGYRQAHPFVPVVVCSRRADYLSQAQQLELQRAVVVQPLTTQQIDAYLASVDEQVAGLRLALRDDPALQELATTPLLLSILTRAYQDMPLDKTTESRSFESRQEQLFASYVQHMLERPSAEMRYTPEQTKHWLRSLARQMKRQSQTIFYLEQMQPDWLADQGQRRAYDQIAVTFSALLIGILSCWLLTLVWPGNLALTSLIRPGILAGLLGFIFARRNLAHAPNAPPSQRKELQSAILKGGLIAGILTALVWGWVTNGNFFDSDPRAFQGSLIAGLTTCCGWILIGLFIQRISRLQRRADPQGLYRISLRFALIIGIFTGFIATMRSDIAYWWFWQPNSQGPIVGLTYAISEGVMFGILSAFLSVVLDKHNGTISPTETLHWSVLSLLQGLFGPDHFRNAWRVTLLMICLESAIFVFWVGRYVDFNAMTQPGGLLYGLVNGVTVGLIFGVNYWLFLGLGRGVSSHLLDQAHRLLPNQGIRQSFNNGIRVGLVTMCLNSGLSMLSVFLQLQMRGDAVPISYAYLLLVGINAAIASFLLSWLLTGGLAWLQHYFLRCLLWSEKLQPLRYAQFLNHAVERELLNRVGGGYIFVHRLLLDYFASLEKKQS